MMFIIRKTHQYQLFIVTTSSKFAFKPFFLSILDHNRKKKRFAKWQNKNRFSHYHRNEQVNNARTLGQLEIWPKNRLNDFFIQQKKNNFILQIEFRNSKFVVNELSITALSDAALLNL